jgi:hypothetical protein
MCRHKTPNLSKMRFPRLTIIAAILLIAALWGWRGQQRMAESRKRMAETEERLTAFKTECIALETQFQSMQSNVQRETIERNRVLSGLKNETLVVATNDPASLWVDPPSELPAWISESPYVWLSKETLSRLPITPFSDGGELEPLTAAVLNISDAERKQLNARLRVSLEEYRAAEAAQAQFTTNHLSGVSQFPGEKITITVEPLHEDGKRLQDQFVAALKSHLGDQRSDLISRLADRWLGDHFSHDGTEPKIISATRHENGTYNISVKTGGNSMSVGGPMSLDEHIPAHLLPLFATLQSKENPVRSQ